MFRNILFSVQSRTTALEYKKGSVGTFLGPPVVHRIRFNLYTMSEYHSCLRYNKPGVHNTRLEREQKSI